jgi:hypothetical protein
MKRRSRSSASSKQGRHGIPGDGAHERPDADSALRSCSPGPTSRISFAIVYNGAEGLISIVAGLIAGLVSLIGG